MNNPALFQALAAKCDAVTKLQIARLSRTAKNVMFVHDYEMYDGVDHLSSTNIRFANMFCNDYDLLKMTPYTVGFYKILHIATLHREAFIINHVLGVLDWTDVDQQDLFMDAIFTFDEYTIQNTRANIDYKLQRVWADAAMQTIHTYIVNIFESIGIESRLGTLYMIARMYEKLLLHYMSEDTQLAVADLTQLQLMSCKPLSNTILDKIREFSQHLGIIQHHKNKFQRYKNSFKFTYKYLGIWLHYTGKVPMHIPKIGPQGGVYIILKGQKKYINTCNYDFWL
jgi:hypothetical protein